MGKPVQRKRYKIKQNVTCEQCINCMYIEHGDMYCDEKEDMPLVYDEFCPDKNMSEEQFNVFLKEIGSKETYEDIHRFDPWGVGYDV